MYVFVTGGCIAPGNGFWKIRRTELFNIFLLVILIIKICDDFGVLGLVCSGAGMTPAARPLPVRLPRKSQKVQEQGQNPQERQEAADVGTRRDEDVRGHGRVHAQAAQRQRDDAADEGRDEQIGQQGQREDHA